MLFNAGQILTERARLSPRLEAIVDVAAGVRYDFREFNARANRVAHALRAEGLQPGDRVACLMSNQARYGETYFGCAKAGHVFVALNWRLTVAELSYQLLDSGAAAVVYGADQLALVEPLRAEFPNVCFLPADHGEFCATVDASPAGEPPIGAGGEDALFMMYTSGTTGRPKGALVSHRANLAYMASMLATSGLDSDERQVIVAPMFHIAGLGLLMIAAYAGMTSVILKAFDPALVWDLVDAERISGFFAVPAMLAVLHQHPKREGARRPRLRWVLCGAAPVPVSVIEAWHAMGVQVRQVYGATETHGGICLLTAEHATSKVGSTGLPYFGMDVRVVDLAGEPVPPGVPGEVITRGPHLFSGYWNQPEATRASLRDGWFHTGDIAEVDEDGFIYIKDRSKDMIISGGENVYPAEVENVLSSHPGVAEVGVIGQPSDKWGECACAVVVRASRWPGDDALLVEELQALARTRLAKFKQPRRYVFVEALPRNPSGKILKRLLRESFPERAPE